MRRPKGGETAKVAAATVAAHKCASCKDTLATVVDKATKGPNHLIGKVSRHECAGCDTKIVTEGAGKAKKDLAMHSCNSEAKPLCCAKN